MLGLATAELNGSGCQSRFNGLPSSAGPQGWPAFGPWLDRINLPMVLAGIAAVVVVVFAVLLLLLYVSSVCRFVLIDAIVSTRCAGIRAGWSKWRHVGRRYFRWQLVYHTVLGVGMAVVLGLPLGAAYFAGWLTEPQEHLAPLIVAGLALAAVFVVGIIAALVVYVIAKDFMAPILALDDISVREAWRRLFQMMRADKVAFAGYLGLKFLLSIAAAIVLFSVSLVLFIPLFIVALMTNAGAMGIGSDIGHVAFIAVLGLGGLLLVVALVVLSVPFVVFFPASGLYFLASRHPPLDAWLATRSLETPGPSTT